MICETGDMPVFLLKKAKINTAIANLAFLYIRILTNILHEEKFFGNNVFVKHCYVLWTKQTVYHQWVH